MKNCSAVLVECQSISRTLDPALLLFLKFSTSFKQEMHSFVLLDIGNAVCNRTNGVSLSHLLLFAPGFLAKVSSGFAFITHFLGQPVFLILSSKSIKACFFCASDLHLGPFAVHLL